MAAHADFWGEYLGHVRDAGVPETQATWYLRWAERFARACRGVPLRERSIEDVKPFLDAKVLQHDPGDFSDLLRAKDRIAALAPETVALLTPHPEPSPVPQSFHPASCDRRSETKKSV